ncbi:Fer2LCH [Trypoxylus dichotomus]
MLDFPFIHDYAGEIPGIMKFFAVFVVLFLAAHAAEETCSRNIRQVCRKTGNKAQALISNCNSKYGAIDVVSPDLQRYVNTHITKSFEYLLMSTHYANYEKNREGFEKLFRSFSDDKWNTAIELIKYLGKRGAQMNFSERKQEPRDPLQNEFEVYELESLAKALDIEKNLAIDAHNIHAEASRKKTDYHDPEISSYIEEEFVHKHADNIRKLTGYTQDLHKILMDEAQRSLGLYLFDEYLQKQ